MAIRKKKYKFSLECSTPEFDHSKLNYIKIEHVGYQKVAENTDLIIPTHTKFFGI